MPASAASLALMLFPVRIGPFHASGVPNVQIYVLADREDLLIIIVELPRLDGDRLPQGFYTIALPNIFLQVSYSRLSFCWCSD
jgi:hypothetical protein